MGGGSDATLPAGMPRNVMIPGLRSNPTKSQYIHCLQRGGRAGLIRTQLLGSPLPKGRGGTRAIRPEQAKQQKRRENYRVPTAPGKPGKPGDSFSSLEKSWNFVIFAKYPGKMRQTLEI